MQIRKFALYNYINLPVLICGPTFYSIHQLLVSWRTVIIGPAFFFWPILLAGLVIGIIHITSEYGSCSLNCCRFRTGLCRWYCVRPYLLLCFYKLRSIHTIPVTTMKGFVLHNELPVPVSVPPWIVGNLVLPGMTIAG